MVFSLAGKSGVSNIRPHSYARSLEVSISNVGGWKGSGARARDRTNEKVHVWVFLLFLNYGSINRHKKSYPIPKNCIY